MTDLEKIINALNTAGADVKVDIFVDVKHPDYKIKKRLSNSEKRKFIERYCENEQHNRKR